MIGAQAMSGRVHPEGQSLANSATGESNLDKQIEHLRSKLTQTETARVELSKKNEVLEKENAVLKETIQRFQTDAGGSSLYGEPHLTIDSSENQVLKQKIIPALKAHRLHITKVLDRCKQQKDIINMLATQLEAVRAKGLDYPKIGPSLSSNVVAPLAGPASNYNLTLSLMSTESQLLGSSRPSHLTESSSGMSRYYETARSDSPQRYRREPVESSDHIYGNDVRSQALESGIATLPNISKRSMKAPRPAPRPRTSLRSHASGNSLNMSASYSGNISTFEGDNRPGTITPHNLRTISESHNSASLNLGSKSAGIKPVGPPQPNVLNQNTAPVPGYTEQDSGASARNIHQVCDVCRKDFSDWTVRQFMDHCIECADDATAREESLGESFTKVAPEHSKECPVCTLKFGAEVTQNQFENHVNGHFRDEHARHMGFETIDK